MTSLSEIQYNILHALIETAAEGYLVTDEKGTIIFSNSQIESLFGYTKKEVIGQNIDILLPKEYRNKHKEHRKEFNQNPKKRNMGANIDLWALKKDQTKFRVQVSLNHYHSQGKMFILALVSDITERVEAAIKINILNQELEEKVEHRTKELDKALEAIKESQLLYSAIARNFPKGTINVFDTDLNYIFVEGQELFRYGVTSKMLVGTNYLERLAPEIRPQIEKNLKKVFKGKSISFEVEHKKNYYLLNAVPLADSNGKIKQILVVEKNVTQEKKSEEEIKKMLEKEIQLNELKSRFVSMASHEFRTPLSTILSSTTLIEKYDENGEHEKKKKHLYRIRSSVNNLTGILNDFLSLDKIEEGKVTCTPSEFDLISICKELKEEMQALAKQNQVINCSFQTETIVVQLDKQLLKNIMINLISNAIKYSPENSTIHIKIEIENNLTIHVTDSGIGIPESEQKHLFERFFRAKNSTNIQGTGLGLHIVKKYAEMMNGTVTFNSKENEGTTFTVTLPININSYAN
ncbi:MAG: PAS domain S-box protein [Flavobacteriales bacterium]|nr:PAS domain S-box protein [Flavobacteriales bacterium]